MKKKQGLNFIVPLVIFPFDVMISVGESNFDFEKALERHMPPNCFEEAKKDMSFINMAATCNGRTINFEAGHHTVIRIKEWPHSHRCQGILSHEIFHAVAYVLWRMDIPFEIQKTDEVYAYLIDYLTTEVYKKVFK
jgi:hypothetical protein